MAFVSSSETVAAGAVVVTEVVALGVFVAEVQVGIALVVVAVELDRVSWSVDQGTYERIVAFEVEVEVE